MMNKSAETLYLRFQHHQQALQSLSLRRLFEDDNNRANTFSLNVGGLYFDYSKNHITHETLELFTQLAEERQLSQAIKNLFSGKHVNTTEDRPALHSTLRHQGAPKNERQQQVLDTKKKISGFVSSIENKQWLGFTGLPIKTVVNIGIGGSDLGPRMVVQALSNYKKNINVKFAANIDGADINDILAKINPETTLFIVSSKSFGTQETLENALSAKQWIRQNSCPENKLKQHFIAVTSNTRSAEQFGIDSSNIFPMWDWVGGRYSLWSAIGLPIALSVGMENFEKLLSGAHSMDEHYSNTPPTKNAPVIAGLLSYWYNQFWGSSSHAVLPYAQHLSRLPAYLQQLDMESLGKSVRTNGEPVTGTTGSIIWGTEGSNGQHSYHQLLHQGTQLIPADFIMSITPLSPLTHQHTYLQASCISQSQALLKGKTLADAEQELRAEGLNEAEIKKLAPHKVIAGNKPSNTIILDELNPETLGALISFYEHKVYTLGVLLDINPFDQWGVELGKQLGQPIYNALKGESTNPLWDSSTQALIKKVRAQTLKK